MKTAIKRAVSGALTCCLLALSPTFASALEYRYNADLYDNYFYNPTSSNHARDLDSKDDSGGSTIIVPSDSMGTDADQTTPRTGSPIIPVGSYIDSWGSAVEKQSATDEVLNGLEGVSFNRLEGMSGGYTEQRQLVITNGYFGAVSIGSRGIFAYSMSLFDTGILTVTVSGIRDDVELSDHAAWEGRGRLYLLAALPRPISRAWATTASARKIVQTLQAKLKYELKAKYDEDGKLAGYVLVISDMTPG